MEKYIKVVTAEGAQTLSLSNVKLITYDSAGVDTEIFYLGGAKATLDHLADAGETLRQSLQNAMVALNEKNWRNVRDDYSSNNTLPGTSIGIASIVVS
tara:strand:+ start:334 stop:627 length:294 start_codon:yes stop_codon:yes gene_type:complete